MMNMHHAMNACAYIPHGCMSPAAVFTRCNCADSPYPVKKHVAVIVPVVVVVVVIIIVVAIIIITIITSIIVVAIAIVTATV